jgi:rhamnosyltransferase
MDQDTRALPGMVEALSACYEACPFRDQVGLVAANFYVPAFDRCFVDCRDPDAAYVEHATAITAGSLVRLSAYQTAGGFRDDFFIDFVDNEYSLRLRRQGARVIYSARAIIDHAIGEPKRYKLLWMRPVSSNHSPLRRYYITRNRLVTDSVYFTTDPRAVMQDYYRLIGEAFLFTLLEDRKLAKWWAMALGAWHAIIGRRGKLAKEPWHRL